MEEKLSAHYDNRIYYFYVMAKTENELMITMYSTPYTFIKKDGVWRNHLNNKMNMIQPLIDAVVAAVPA
jgi:hypothetical protein